MHLHVIRLIVVKNHDHILKQSKTSRLTRNCYKQLQAVGLHHHTYCLSSDGLVILLCLALLLYRRTALNHTPTNWRGATIFQPFQSSHREMVKASRHSRAFSIESQATLSTSNTATTNGSTVWGPGTVSGKLIEAFGEATLRRVENIVIRRKLSTYRSLFPHTDDTTIKDIDSIYENILELSRSFTHPTPRTIIQLS